MFNARHSVFEDFTEPAKSSSTMGKVIYSAVLLLLCSFVVAYSQEHPIEPPPEHPVVPDEPDEGGHGHYHGGDGGDGGWNSVPCETLSCAYTSVYLFSSLSSVVVTGFVLWCWFSCFKKESRCEHKNCAVCQIGSVLLGVSFGVSFFILAPIVVRNYFSNDFPMDRFLCDEFDLVKDPSIKFTTWAYFDSDGTLYESRVGWKDNYVIEKYAFNGKVDGEYSLSISLKCTNDASIFGMFSKGIIKQNYTSTSSSYCLNVASGKQLCYQICPDDAFEFTKACRADAVSSSTTHANSTTMPNHTKDKFWDNPGLLVLLGLLIIFIALVVLSGLLCVYHVYNRVSSNGSSYFRPRKTSEVSIPPAANAYRRINDEEAPPSTPRLMTGQRVRIVDLIDQPEYNGREGEVAADQPSSSHCRVAILFNGSIVKLDLPNTNVMCVLVINVPSLTNRSLWG